MTQPMPMAIYTDAWIKTDSLDLNAIRREATRAIMKHGWEQTPLNPLMTDAEKLIILVEEVGEVARAMTYDEGSNEGLREEALQVATMAFLWYASFEGDK